VILLDTHAWVWWLSDPEKLSTAARERIDAAVEGDRVLVSAISAWELALLVKKGRLELDEPVEEWIARAEALPFLEIVPMDSRIAVYSVLLPEPLHDDPADRIIIATAATLGIHLVTKDAKIHDYPGVQTLW